MVLYEKRRHYATCFITMHKNSDARLDIDWNNNNEAFFFSMRYVIFMIINIGNLFGLLGGYRGEIGDLTVVCQGKELIIECRIHSLDQREIRQMLDAGEILEFKYQIEYFKERRLWFDHHLGQYGIQKILSFNNLTKQYFARKLELGKKMEERIFDDFHSAFQWFVTLKVTTERLDDSSANKKEYIRLRVLQRKSRMLFIIPREISTRWKKIRVTCQ